MSANRVFNDAIIESNFNRDGFVKLPFLSREEVEALKNYYYNSLEKSGGQKQSENLDFNVNKKMGYDFTFIDEHSDYKKNVFRIISEVFEKKTDSILNQYRPIIANFIRKEFEAGEVPMHQNWAFVDEEKYTSVSVWVPLIDSHENNGTLQLVRGSHKRFGKIRGPMIPWELKELKSEILSRHMTPMIVQVGDCVILDDSIVHYSAPNHSNDKRLAIQLILVPKAADTVHYHFDKTQNPNEVEMYETSQPFYMEFHPWLKPKELKLLAKLPYHEKTFSYSEFLIGMAGERFDGHKLNKPNALFQDAKLQDCFEKDGYVKIPLLDTATVNDLKEYYLQHDQKGLQKNGFHVSLDNIEAKHIESVFKKLFDTLLPPLSLILKDFKAFTASYVIKEPHVQNIVPPHQDWTFVDETKHCSATVWVALMDVTKENGALGVIKGSHQLFQYPRQSPSPETQTILSGHAATLFKYIEIIEMRAGEALIFDNRTIHASPNNNSNEVRIAAGIGITQKDADLLHFYECPGDEAMIHVYKVNETFFSQYNNAKFSAMYNAGEIPGELELCYSYKKNYPQLSQAAMERMVKTLDQFKNNKQESEEEMIPSAIEQNKSSVLDQRSFFEKYSIPNIIAEIKYRLKNVDEGPNKQ